MQEFQQIIEFFIKNEGPWAVLFILFYTLEYRNNRKRETALRGDIDQLNQYYSGKLDQIAQDSALILETWKLIIEREIERRETKSGARLDSSKRGRDYPGNRSAGSAIQNDSNEPEVPKI
jgi:hypothetical protein